MKYLRTLALAATAAIVLMAFGGTASATSLTVTTAGGTTDTVTAGAFLAAELEAGTKWTLKSSFIGQVTCANSTFAFAILGAGGASETVKGPIETLDFGECNGNVTTLSKGSFEIHTEGASANGNGTITSDETEITVEIAGLHCIFTTNNTDIGRVTGTHSGHVIIHAESGAIPRTGGRGGAFCGTSATLKATYTFFNLNGGGSNFTNFTVD